MARGRRRAPVAPLALKSTDPEPVVDVPEEDVDDFVESRHRALADSAVPEESEDNGSDLGIGAEEGVMDIAVSDSSGSDSGAEESSEDEDDVDPEDADMDTQWGGRRRMWYGGDTGEYEIMDEEEQRVALKEEEEEALRLQAKSLSRLTHEDFVGSSEEESDDEQAGGDEDAGLKNRKHLQEDGALVGTSEKLQSTVDVAPELPALLVDFRDCVRELPELRKRCEEKVGSPDIRRISYLRYHILSGLASNVAFYLTLRTDPESAGVDVRAHPVIAEIVRLRSLREKVVGLTESFKDMEDREAPSDVDSRDLGEVEGTENGSEKATAGSWDVQDTTLKAQLMSGNAENGASLKVKKKGQEKKRRKVSTEKKRRSSRAPTNAEAANSDHREDADDASFVRSIVGVSPNEVSDDCDAENVARAKRQKLNKIVGSLERDRQSRAARRAAPADMQSVRQEPAVSKLPPRNSIMEDDALDVDAPGESLTLNDESSVDLGQTLGEARKSAKRARKKSAAQVPHVYSYDDRIKDKDSRRKASSQVVKNRGLTRYRPRDKKTPRAKNREAFSKAVKKRKSVVRDPVSAKPNSYGGEASGINMRARKGSRLSDV